MDQINTKVSISIRTGIEERHAGDFARLATHLGSSEDLLRQGFTICEIGREIGTGRNRISYDYAVNFSEIGHIFGFVGNIETIVGEARDLRTVFRPLAEHIAFVGSSRN